MPERGRLTDWDDARGFGYIKPLGGGPTVFVHISEFPSDLRRPQVTDLLTYETGRDERGRTRAVGVSFLSAASARSLRTTGRPSSAPRSYAPGSTRLAMLVSATFMLVLIALAGIGVAYWYVPLIYVVMSVLTAVVYAQDKRAAMSGQWRTGEGTLIGLGLFGGWPGALIAQQVLRHKTRKQPFLTAFWISIVANIALLAALLRLMPPTALS